MLWKLLLLSTTTTMKIALVSYICLIQTCEFSFAFSCFGSGLVQVERCHALGGTNCPNQDSDNVLDRNIHNNNNNNNNNNRRFFIGAVTAIANLAVFSSMNIPNAFGVTKTEIQSIIMEGSSGSSTSSTTSTTGSSIPEMKKFVDPYGMFDIEVPEEFFTLRRTAKGDLPDAQGKGRRGSSIFTAGNMAKAEVVAVERFPTRRLLEENGIEATTDLNTFPDIGEPSVVAGLLYIRREKDRPASGKNTVLDPQSVKVSLDGKELQFKLRTEIDVQKPELLMEQSGVDRLFRITLAKASLGSNDGNLLAVFASALESDFQSQDGEALQRCVDSFRVMDREFGF